MEIKMLKVLQFKLNPVTKNIWANLYILHWDIFMEENINFLRNKKPVFFKKPNQISYQIYREFF
jgi:hypothetical protein